MAELSLPPSAFTPQDQAAISAAQLLLAKVKSSRGIDEFERSSVAKLEAAVADLRILNAETGVIVTVGGDHREFQLDGKPARVSRYWEVSVSRDTFNIHSGGALNHPIFRRVSFGCMHWSWTPGYDPMFCDSFEDHLRLMPWLLPFDAEVAAFNLALPGFVIAIKDYDNHFLPRPKYIERRL